MNLPAGFSGIFGLFVGRGTNGTSLQGLCLQLPPCSLIRSRSPPGFLFGLEMILSVGEGLLSPRGLFVHGSLDVPGCSEARLDGSVYPGVGQAGVLASKVDAALRLEKLLRIVHKLVGCELSEGAHDEGVQRPVLDHRRGAHAPQLLLGDLVHSRQVLQDDIHHLVVLHGYEEEGVVVHGVGGQQDPLAAGEAMAGVVDVTRGPVGDGNSTPDAIPLPEGLVAGQNYLAGTGIMHGAERIHLVPGERGLKGDESRGLGRGGDDDKVRGEGGQRRVGFTHPVGNPDLRPIPHYRLYLGAQKDGARLQAGVESFGELVKASSDLGKAVGVKRGERVSVGDARSVC